MAFVWALKSGGWKWFSHVTTVQCSINKHGTWKDDETFPLVMEPFATLMMKLDDLPIKSWPLSWQTVRLPPGIIQYSPTYNDNSPIISPFYNVCWLLHFFLQCLFIICFSIFLGVWIPKTSPKIPVPPDPRWLVLAMTEVLDPGWHSEEPHPADEGPRKPGEWYKKGPQS